MELDQFKQRLQQIQQQHKSGYQIIEVTDLITNTKSYKIYRRAQFIQPPVAIGIPTRAEAEARVRELEQEPQS